VTFLDIQMTAVKVLNLEPFDTDNRSHSEHSGRNTFHITQHGQPGPTSPATQAIADQDSTQPLSPEEKKTDSSLADRIRLVRKNQQVDLAMLRLSFRKLILPEEEQDSFDEKHSAHPVRLFTASEFSNLVSAVTRVHTDERETFGIEPPDPNQSNEQNELRKLESFTLAELFDLCRREGISPPDSCQTPPEENDLPANGEA
jgi:hypothetical protein